jgi:Arc/MetJ-type ribon-helix-helix transcriptional regulator
MDITLTHDQEAFIRRAIESGRFERVEDAVTEAILLWEERETRRAGFLASLADAEASLDRGDGIPITRKTMQTLAEDVKRRGRERIARERQGPA